MKLHDALVYATKKLVQQKHQCENNAHCLYIDGKGNHCAIGWLLIDKDHPEIARFTGDVYTLCHAFPESVPEVVHENDDLFAIFQQFHDADTARSRAHILQELRDHSNLPLDEPCFDAWVKLGFGEPV